LSLLSLSGIKSKKLRKIQTFHVSGPQPAADGVLNLPPPGRLLSAATNTAATHANSRPITKVEMISSLDDDGKTDDDDTTALGFPMPPVNALPAITSSRGAGGGRPLVHVVENPFIHFFSRKYFLHSALHPPGIISI